MSDDAQKNKDAKHAGHTEAHSAPTESVTTPTPDTKKKESATAKESAPTTPSVVVEPAAQQPQGSNYLPPSIIFTLGIATAISYLLFKFVRLRVAERVKRWAPLGHVAVWSFALILSGAIAIRQTSTEWMVFGMAIVFTVVLLNLNWLRSVLAGVALTFEHHLEVGDSVRIGILEGDIVHFGLRATRIRAVDGTLHDIPNAQLLTEEVANLSGDGSDSACRVQVIVPDDLTIDQARKLALQAAILSPIASPRHRPEIFLAERDTKDAPARLQIRGYAFDPNYQDHFRSDVLERVAKMFEEARVSKGSSDL